MKSTRAQRKSVEDFRSKSKEKMLIMVSNECDHAFLHIAAQSRGCFYDCYSSSGAGFRNVGG